MQNSLHALKALCFFMVLSAISSAQCPIGDPSIDASAWDGNSTIEQNFNNARRWEETNRGLAANCLGNMDAPPGDWESYSDDEIALYIHNSERTCRTQLPLYAVETNLDGVSQAHATWQINTDVFSHTGNPALGTAGIYTICPNTNLSGSTINQRINANSILNNCWTYISENIASAVASNQSNSIFNNFIPRSIYLFLYRDASSGWGHRHNILHVYSDNNGSAGTEGFIGIGVEGGPNFLSYSYGCFNWGYAMILTIDYFDPNSSCNNFTYLALPVELISFHCEGDWQSIDLTWETASEYDNAYFAVEKSLDGTHFQEIGIVPAAGESRELKSYGFTDLSPDPGRNYFRIRQVDVDGAYGFSNIINLTVIAENGFSASPNPFTDRISLYAEQAPDMDLQWILLSMEGRMLRSGVVAEGNWVGKVDVPLYDIPSGLYYLKIQSGQHQTIIKLLKLQAVN